jgi:cation:H+ antiporter
MASLIWSFPAIMVASIVIGWAAEAAAIRISAGLALAILALLQTLPEFGVEAYIAWTGNTSLMLANLTGSLRLFVGLGWPVVFFIHAFCSRKQGLPKEVRMPKSFAVEASFLSLPVFYFLVIYFKKSISVWDGLVLCFFYGAYLWYLNLQRLYLKHSPQEHFDEDDDDLEFVPQQIMKLSKAKQNMSIWGLFLLGGATLLFSVHPFVEGLKWAALFIGMSEFVFIQWVAPFASEFPEKITAFGWATKAKKVPMAIFNMVSSSVNQWTLLAGFVPIVYSLSLGNLAVVDFNSFQQTEILLTVAQSVLGILFLSDLRFQWHEAVALFVLWFLQFAVPSTRVEVMYVYALLIAITAIKILARGRMPIAWSEFLKMTRWILSKRSAAS